MSSSPIPLLMEVHLEQAAQEHVQTDFEDLQGRRLFWVEGKDHLSWAVHNFFPNIAKNIVSLLSGKGTLLSHVQLGVYQDSYITFCRASLGNDHSTNPVRVQEVFGQSLNSLMSLLLGLSTPSSIFFEDNLYPSVNLLPQINKICLLSMNQVLRTPVFGNHVHTVLWGFYNVFYELGKQIAVILLHPSR